jgi:sterol desaturase/sphingolipid hydroxylase (fatty acid hydroxylase superfamily)
MPSWADCILPVLWPEANLFAVAKECENDDENGKTTVETTLTSVAKPIASLKDHLTVLVSATRAYLIALLCIYMIHGGEDESSGYPAYGRAAEWNMRWMAPILLRNVLGTWLIAGGWDWYLYFSPYRPTLQKHKLNPIYPSVKQMKHDFKMTTFASICGTFIECLLCHGYATSFKYSLSTEIIGTMPSLTIAFPNPSETSPWNILTLLLAITLVHWRDIHFFTAHRLMHPWNIAGLPRSLDGGYWLYKYVHSLHHKSHNPTALSGTSMHPIEATIYYSAACMPFWGVAIDSNSNTRLSSLSLSLSLCANWIHPAIPLAVIVDCGVAAWLGHAGFDFPGTGDIYHHLHHACFDCNYGGPLMPFDYFLGTFASCKKDLPNLWRKKRPKDFETLPIGPEGNEMPVH